MLSTAERKQSRAGIVNIAERRDSQNELRFIDMNRLKELRKKRGLSQQALANELGVHYRTLQNWENGESNIKPEKAQQLADFLGVNTAYLLGYSDFPARILREILFHEIKAEKEYKVIRIGNENFISENRVLNIIDKYVS
jgi:transcriptional regulator with XRE-family HTH domain